MIITFLKGKTYLITTQIAILRYIFIVFFGNLFGIFLRARKSDTFRESNKKISKELIAKIKQRRFRVITLHGGIKRTTIIAIQILKKSIIV